MSLRLVQPPSFASSRGSSLREPVADIVARLEQEQAVLREGVEARRRMLAQTERQNGSRGGMLTEIEKEIMLNRMLAGLTEVHGPGVVVTLADGERPPGQDERPETVIIHDYDVIDVINALWAGGAEAISVNGERLVFGSYIYCVGSTLIVGERRLSTPLVITAIGDQASMSRVLAQDPELEYLRRRALKRAVVFQVEARQQVVCPAYLGAMVHKFARTGD
ncbi:MAG: DUF881 domain-containing protein [Anaerolineae bacterium]